MRLLLVLFLFLFVVPTASAIVIDPVEGNGTVTNGPNTPPPPCNSSTPASNLCEDAPFICDLNGYCGNTSASYTNNSWGSLDNAFPGSIENNSFITFTAGASTVSFNLWVYNCLYGDGIQMMIFSAPNCGGTVVNQLSWNPATAPASSQVVTINGLTAGQNYYIMIDGYAGDVCNYAISTNQNSNIYVPPTITASETTLCSGQPVTLTATGGNGIYNWIAGNGIPANTSGSSVTFTPPGPGTYTYATQSDFGNENCTQPGQGEVTLVVENCGCTITASASEIELCAEALVPIELNASLEEVGTISWTGPNGFTANGATVSNVTLPSTPGTYQYIANGVTNDNECTSIATVTIHPTPAGTIDVVPTITCANPNPTVTVTATNTEQVEWSLNGTTVGTEYTHTLTEPGNYTINMTSENGCTHSISQVIPIDTIHPQFSLSNPNILTCITTETTISITAPATTYNYAWTGPSILSGATTSSILAGAIGTYEVTATNPLNGCTTQLSSMVTNDLTAPTITLTEFAQINCTSPTAKISTLLSPANSSVAWTGPNGFSATTPSILAGEAGAFVITATHPVTGCTSTQQSFVTANFAQPSSVFSADILSECTPFTSTLQAQNLNDAYEYNWYINGQFAGNDGPIHQVELLTNTCLSVELVVRNTTNGCATNTLFNDYICGLLTPTAGIHAQPPYLMTYDNPTVVFTSTSLNSTGHYWILPSGISEDDASLIYDFSGHETGQWFTIVANYQDRCFDTTRFFLALHNDVYLFVPNAFTPDGDARNNTFKVSLTGDFDGQSFNMYIFNRWGEMVWESHDPEIGWDGTYNGTLVPDGSYTWTIDFKRGLNDEKLTYAGNVTLIK